MNLAFSCFSSKSKNRQSDQQVFEILDLGQSVQKLVPPYNEIHSAADAVLAKAWDERFSTDCWFKSRQY